MELGGVVLGLLSLVWPIWYWHRRERGERQSHWPMFVSLGCCVLSLWDQLAFRAHMLVENHLSTWQDTAGVPAIVSGLLLILVLGVNAVVLCADKEREQNEKP